MYSTESNSGITTNAAEGSGADLAVVTVAERLIRSHLERNDLPAIEQACRALHAELVGRYCMAVLGDLRLASETALQVWSSFAQEVDQLADAVTIRARLLRIARRRCAHLLETRGSFSEPLSEVPDAHEPQAREAEQLALPRMARRLLSQLRPSEREILLLRYLNQLTYAELAEIWGTTDADVRSRISQALVRAMAISRGKEFLHG